MSQFTLKQLFSIDVPTSLNQSILTSLQVANKAHLKNKIMVLGSIFVVSISVCATAIWSAYSKFIAGASPKYLSLLLSDRTEVAILWKQFAAVIAESIPLMSVMVALVALATTLYVLRKLLRTLSNTESPAFAL